MVYLCSTMSGALGGKTKSGGDLTAVLSLTCLAVGAGFWLNPSTRTLFLAAPRSMRDLSFRTRD